MTTTAAADIDEDEAGDDDDEDDEMDANRVPNASQPPPGKKCQCAPWPSVVLTDHKIEVVAEFLQAN